MNASIEIHSKIIIYLQDLQANLYDSYYLNFTNQISRDLLEELAQAVHQTGSHAKIAKVRGIYYEFLIIF